LRNSQVKRKRKNLTPEERRRAERLRRIMNDRRSTLRTIADAAIKLARLEYERPGPVEIDTQA
jgi:hypothetical protein